MLHNDIVLEQLYLQYVNTKGIGLIFLLIYD
jgi:hypothetical protein